MITCIPTSETDETKLADLITGGMEKAEAAHRRDWKPSGDVAVRVRDLRVGPGRPPLSFEVERGEIFGLTGLLGAGAETIVRMLGGAEALNGTIEIDGATRTIRDPRQANQLGVGFIPEDRKAAGLIREQDIAHQHRAPIAAERLARRGPEVAGDPQPGRAVSRRTSRSRPARSTSRSGRSPAATSRR